MNILSLCDGMSCGHIALDRAGVKVDRYFAAEIKDIGMKVAAENYPDTVFIGDVNKITYSDGVLHTEKGDYDVQIDMVMFGSPCQSFSIAMKNSQRIGLLDRNKSGLFLECYRILCEVYPRFFFMENVASMKEADKKAISEMLGVEPICCDSADVSPALRNRLYWMNIPGACAPQKINIALSDVLTSGYTNRNKARALLVSDSRPLTTPIHMMHRYMETGFTTLIFKSEQHYRDCVAEYKRLAGIHGKMTKEQRDAYNGDVFDGVRYMNQTELERCQTVPEGYTKCLTRNEAADVLGDGWTVDVIAHFFRYLPNEYRLSRREGDV
jgi:hypothetical protein